MNFRSFKIRPFAVYLLGALLYPAFAYLSSGRQMIKLIDALTVMGLIFLVIGLVYAMILHGDFDITEYVARRSLRRNDVKPFQAFKDDKKEERKDSANYPFFTGVFLLLMAAGLTIFAY